ncbi:MULTISPECIES: ligase-associated DNA damage response endonuclease PdeM [Cyanophyceae]|uniref:Ligase-associated DNA damage response endonuclease PdeM n=1 Tax=Leptolyngbya subtilissima DQ-A4 TaxID=2933933 RepID=A0ABV0K6P8_9CYAN|nr:ligase-associated DNA damage response endonuclease PdeM [Nodosilinea sp. FACHB-141]MBD2114000.1 ligase-associated DNA damage response endonuclease PdeM [Nodosilinea sp. FACHB-141]
MPPQAAVETLTVGQTQLLLLPEWAVYVETLGALLVSDVHLGKAETFQHYGLPVPSQVNHGTLGRLEALCAQHRPNSLWILGDLFHGRVGMDDEVIDAWLKFLHRTQVSAHLILGNHDRPLEDILTQLSVECFVEAVEVGGVLFSHEPDLDPNRLNICGHIHPCFRLSMGCDRLRLPCFHWQPRQSRLTLPSFGEFTGGYDIALAAGEMAYVVAEGAVVGFGR